MHILYSGMLAMLLSGGTTAALPFAGSTAVAAVHNLMGGVLHFQFQTPTGIARCVSNSSSSLETSSNNHVTS
jgi:hypothetical protein